MTIPANLGERHAGILFERIFAQIEKHILHPDHQTTRVSCVGSTALNCLQQLFAQHDSSRFQPALANGPLPPRIVAPFCACNAASALAASACARAASASCLALSEPPRCCSADDASLFFRLRPLLGL